MSLASLIRKMADAGATPEVIALAIEAIEAEQSKIDEAREKARDRKRKQRAGQSRDGHVTDAGQACDIAADDSSKKEIPPTPPKEKTITPKKPTVSFPQTPTKRATRLPADWKPSDTGWQFAVNLISASRAAFELDKFRDYWTAKGGAAATKLDWEGTWRNWVRSASEKPPPRLPFGQPNNTPPPPRVEKPTMSEAEQIEASRRFHEQWQASQK